MKIKNILTIAITLLTVQFANAQSSIMKDPVSFKLRNGLTVIVAENKGVTKVHTSLTNDDATVDSHAGLQHILTTMLNQSSGNSGITYTENGGNMLASTKEFSTALSVLSAAIQDPTFNQAAFEKAKTTVIASVIAKDRYYPTNITEASLAQLTLKDLKAFYTNSFTPAKTYLTIAGNISVAEAKNLAERSFANWSTASSRQAISR